MKMPQWLVRYSWQPDHMPIGYPYGGRVVHIWKSYSKTTQCGKHLILVKRMYGTDSQVCSKCLKWAEKNIDAIEEGKKDEKV
jgi:hypothetical protein